MAVLGLVDTELQTLRATREAKEGVLMVQYVRVANAVIDGVYTVVNDAQPGDWIEDGIGSCHASPHMFDDGLDGELALALPRKWPEIAYEARQEGRVLGGDPGHSACPYHEKDKGCILGGYRPARCLLYVDERHYDIMSSIDPDDTIRTIFKNVMDAKRDKHFEINPEDNSDYVEASIRHIEGLAETARKLLKNPTFEKN